MSDVDYNTKLSDLTAFLQGQLFRLAAILTINVLTVTAASQMSRLLPLDRLPPTVPLPVYLATVALTVSAFQAAQGLGTPAEVRRPLIGRLAAHTANGSFDAVPSELQQAFIREFLRKQRILAGARNALRVGIMGLIIFAYVTVVTVVLREMIRFVMPDNVFARWFEDVLPAAVTPDALFIHACNAAAMIFLVIFWWQNYVRVCDEAEKEEAFARGTGVFEH